MSGPAANGAALYARGPAGVGRRSRTMSSWRLVAAWVAVPFCAAAAIHDRFTLSALTIASAQGLFAVSWLPLAAAGRPSLGHALPYGAGAYAAAVLARSASPYAGALAGLAPVLLAAAGAVAGGLVADVQGRLTRRAAPEFVVAVTFATAEAARALAAWAAPALQTGPDAGITIPSASLAPDEATAVWMAAVFGAGVLAVAAILSSRLGIALRAAAGDERDAAVLGFDVPRVRVVAFTIAGTIAGASGALAALLAARTSVSALSLPASLFVVTAVLLGGPGTVAGPAAAAYGLAAAGQLFTVRTETQGLVFAAVLAAACLRDPARVLGPAFTWTRPANPARRASWRTGA
jgi:branched-chain amino acid transport system permease protein